MGDFNDDPVNESIKKYIATVADIKQVNNKTYFNPMEKFYRRGIGTLAFQDSWNLFDQLLLNRVWLDPGSENWQYLAVKIYSHPHLINDYGQYKGYPLRTYSGAVYTGGYSDHFPVYILITKEQ